MDDRASDPLKTLELVVGVIVSLMAVLLALSVVGSVFGSGSIPGLTAEV